MATRVLGRTGSRRRRRLTLAPILAVALLALLIAAGAQAVHDEGLMQLDGNATFSPDSTPSAAEDWDSICKAHFTPTGECEPNPDYDFTGVPDTQATSHAFAADAFGADVDDVFTTGGSKDDLEISSWKFKNATPSPDKADLEHAMAARYTKDSEEFIYFAADRFANPGNVNVAFWLLQDEVAQNGNGADPTLCTSGSGCGFSGLHVEHGPGDDGITCYPGQTGGSCPGAGEDDTRGDILIVSAFTGGGDQPNISVYEWVGLGNAPNALKVTSDRSVVRVPTDADLTDGCATAGLMDDVGCAITNSTQAITAPWTFTDKSTGGSDIEPAEFFEGGLNLTALGFGDTCFATFVVNTRSSQSVDSVLHDFALGQLGNCDSDITTTPKLSDGTTNIPSDFNIGTGSRTVKDSAVIDVNGVTTWSGTLKFFLCFIGTDTTSTALCDASTSALTGTQIGTTIDPVSNSTTQPIVSEAATITSAGRYCWRAEFDSNTKGVPDDSDSASTECFNVAPVTPMLSTQAVDANGNNITTAVPFNTPLFDKATLSGTANKPGTPVINPTTAGGAATGTITFKLYGPTATAASGGAGDTAFATACASLAAGFATQYPNGIQVSVNGDGSYTTPSPGFTPQAPGFYHWKASYGGDSPNTNPSGEHNTNCGQAAEVVEVLQLQPTMNTAQRFVPNDSATISVASGAGNLAGSVVFKLFVNDSDCSEPPAFTSPSININTGQPNPGTPALTKTVSSGNTTAYDTNGTTFHWVVEYTSTNPAHKNVTSPCGNEHSSITISNGTQKP
jgi:hypothetical protein